MWDNLNKLSVKFKHKTDWFINKLGMASVGNMRKYL